MPGKHKRTVVVALHTYTNADGVASCTALRGQTIEIDDDELERSERLGAVTEDKVVVVPSPVVEPLPPVAQDEAGKLLDEPDEPVKRTSAPRK